MSWINEPEGIDGYLGFVYVIESPSGMKYVGKKLFWSTIRRKPLKGKNRVRVCKVESNWRKYYGSSKELLAEMERKPAGWRREIVHLCTSKWEMAYVELRLQMGLDALFRPDYYNSIIHVRLNKPPAGLVLSGLHEKILRLVSRYHSKVRVRERRRVRNP